SKHDGAREHRAHRAERLGDDRGMVAECRRQHAGPDDDARRPGTQRPKPCQRKRRMAVDMLPWLEVVADEDRVEADFLSKAREVQQLTRRKLLRRSLVSELDHCMSPGRRSLRMPWCRSPKSIDWRATSNQPKQGATMHLGIALPFGDIGGDGPIVREFAQLAGAEGYEGLTLADHGLGGDPANPASRPA